MVVGHFAVICYPVNVRLSGVAFSKGHIVTQPQDQGSGGCLHVLRQILAVRSRIGCQLLFIERLHIIKGLLSRIAINTVTFPLQSCKVIKAGRLYSFYLLFHRTHKSGVVVTVHTDFFSLGSFRHFFAGSSKTSAGDFRHIKRLTDEGFNIRLTLYQKCQCR